MVYLSETQEDYLLDILEHTTKSTVARIKDIAKTRNVSLPTVVSAIKTLAEKNIINHEKYGYITLTDYGIELAKNLLERKKNILRFLTFTLGIPEDIAIIDAHKLEHDLSKQTYEQFIKLTDFLAANPLIKEQFDKFAKREAYMKLNEINVGETAKIVKIENSPIKSKLLSMGTTPGVQIKVEKVAPLGDPIEVTLLGYHLTLRKDEAEKIIVER
ncbi:MAG: DtxR family transcriptional regulator [Desulfurella sp.]|jgi:DtxR family Mn-dependent transcriptional regulator|uniref:Transcriptional regulator MntR n=3 Tax=Desulfurella TaxID=33001 RepID=A0A1G6I2Y8_9BACT|nr:MULTISPECIES: DtxR family transcriptional regulator [Desulfurella]PMP89724.1 MAG: DtxR family transcriptional regulator [Desulfurella sp.]SDC00800.1 iron (metal) dependent repressor, DtxR family [Desulfurella multipotens]HEX13390.1 DtxR family transcriptional regulator [Desulfurella acetivorans]